MLCKSCGNPIPDGVMFCPECGFSVQEQHNSESQGSRKLIESDTSSTLSSPHSHIVKMFHQEKR